MTNSPIEPVYRYTITIPSEAIDENGHVNNVHYVQWMQAVAVRHYEFIGGLPPTQALGATWVVRSHHIEYLSPAFLGDEIEVRTWVVDIRRVRSLRRYEFVRKSDGKTLVKGETDWVFVEAKTGRPLAVPPDVIEIFPLLPIKNNQVTKIEIPLQLERDFGVFISRPSTTTTVRARRPSPARQSQPAQPQKRE